MLRCDVGAQDTSFRCRPDRLQGRPGLGGPRDGGYADRRREAGGAAGRRCARHVPQAAARTCAACGRAAGQSREGLRHLAELELGRGRRRGRGARLRARGAGLPARRQARRSSATTGRGSIGRSPRRRRWAACRCRSTRTAIADEMAFVLDHAEVRFAVAEDQEQVDKLAEIKERCPLLEAVIFSDPRGMRHYDQPWLDDYAKVQERGREFAAQRTRIFSPAKSPRGGAATPRSSSTPRGRPGSPRASSSASTTSSSLREERDRVRGLDATARRCWPICRWRGSASTSSPTRRPIAPAFAPPARNRRRR